MIKKNFRPILKFIIGWPLTLVAFFYIGKFLFSHISQIGNSIIHANIFFLFLSVFCFLCYFFLRALFWHRILVYKSYVISYKETAFLWGFSEIKRYIPGNIWSFLSRADAFAKKQIPKKDLASGLFIEVEYMLIATLLLSLLSINFIVYGILPHFSNKPLIMGIIIIFVFLLTFLYILNNFLLKTLKIKKLRDILEFSQLKLHLFPHFPITQNLFLFIIMLSAFFFYGLGTYFSISSFLYLYPVDFNTFIGFFVFAYFVGYISFVTPMGLGVREGIVTIGLSKFIPSLTLASFGAIIARFMLVISELCFLGIFFLWRKIKSDVVLHLEQRVTTYNKETILALFIVAYFIYFLTISILRYTNFYAGRFDLGNMDQVVWNTLHGRIFQFTDPDGVQIISRLAIHADFILIFLAPFYLFWQDPQMLLLIQTIIVALGAIFVFLLGKDILKDKTIALILAVCYLFNPSIELANLYDFHAVALATTFLLGCFYFVRKKKYTWSVILLFLAALTKEEVWIITAIMGLYLLFFEKKKVLGISIFTISTAVFFYLVSYAIPHARGGQHFVLSYYSDFGSSPKEIIKTILFSPQKTIVTIFQPGQLRYLFELFFPFGFLSIIGLPFLLFIAPELTADLLSTNSHPHEIYYQYTATLTPFIIIAAVYGIKFLRKRFPAISLPLISVYLLISTLLSAYFFGPLPISNKPNLDMIIKPQEYSEILNDFVENMPKKFSVATTNNVGAHLSHRQKIFTIPIGIDQADIIAFLLDDPNAQPSLAAQKIMAEKMKRDKNYIEIFKLGDFVVFEKRNLYTHTEPDTKRTKFFPLSIPTLQGREFIGSTIKIEKTIEKNNQYTSYLASYLSDGLKIYALVDIPASSMPKDGFPVIIINTGSLLTPADTIETSYKKITDVFVKQGFLVLKPEYRGKGNSENDTNLPTTLSYPIDVLNLISSISNLQQADMHNIFLWGHSLGGEVTLATLAAYDQNRNFTIPLKGAAVWAPITDPLLGYTRLHALFPDKTIPYTNEVKLLGTGTKNAVLWQSFSPLFYTDDITIPLEIMHGTSDNIVPFQWSIELYDDMVSSGNKAYLYIYPNDDHNFSASWIQATQENIRFFKTLLSK